MRAESQQAITINSNEDITAAVALTPEVSGRKAPVNSDLASSYAPSGSLTGPHQRKAAGLNVRSMADNFDAPDTIAQPIIEDLLFPGLTLFHAPPKRGKTFLAVQIVKAIITGKPMEEYFSVSKSGRVLYLSEMSEAHVGDHLKT